MIEGKKEYLLVKNNSKMIQTKRKSWQFLFVNLERRNISEKCHQTLLTNGSMVSEKKNLKIFSVVVRC
jgi:hypothetical protein